VRAVRTRYVVDGWGEGELWTGDGVVLAHDFDFAAVSDTGAEDGAAASLGGLPVGAGGGAGSPRKSAVSPCGTVGTELRLLALDENRCLTPDEIVERVTAFLAGEDVALADVPLDLGSSTPFQRDVTAALRAIPRGHVVSYGELAAIAGYPRAGRAVGTICATNQFMLFVPCHRVVASDGIGGYGSAGVGVKRRLLALEGVFL
jgi:O-6-methylguanine DNA methyltransferase